MNILEALLFFCLYVGICLQSDEQSIFKSDPCIRFHIAGSIRLMADKGHGYGEGIFTDVGANSAAAQDAMRWRGLQLSKAKLKASSRTSGLLSG